MEQENILDNLSIVFGSIQLTVFSTNCRNNCTHNSPFIVYVIVLLIDMMAKSKSKLMHRVNRAGE